MPSTNGHAVALSNGVVYKRPSIRPETGSQPQDETHHSSQVTGQARMETPQRVARVVENPLDKFKRVWANDALSQ